MIVELGNVAPLEPYREEVREADHTRDELAARAKAEGLPDAGTKSDLAARLSGVNRTRPLDTDAPRSTVVQLPDDTPLGEALLTITRLWALHSAEPAAWVASDSASLEALLAEHFDCEAGKPGDVEATHYTLAGPPGVYPEEG